MIDNWNNLKLCVLLDIQKQYEDIYLLYEKLGIIKYF